MIQSSIVTARGVDELMYRKFSFLHHHVPAKCVNRVQWLIEGSVDKDRSGYAGNS